MYDMDFRDYDPAIARWVVLDPVVHHSLSPYNAFDNNPVFWADPSGADAIMTDSAITYTGADAGAFFNAFIGAMDGESTTFTIGGTFYDLTSEGNILDTDGIGPPVHFFGNVGGESVIAFFRALEKKSEKIRDGSNFVAMGHGDFEDGRILNFENSEKDIYTAKDFDRYMKEKSPEFKKAVEERRPFTLTLMICWSGTSFSKKGALAKQISLLYPWATISGFDGRGYFTRDSKNNPHFRGIGNGKRPKGFDGTMPMDGNGSMVYYQNGIETYRISSSLAKGSINALIK